ncbi:hypothetical protein SAMN06265795_101620 [Noviherbaspirillum humi]|uniref:Esterase n=1 Tax=Noviherbaspirillum humi TaxID=1688639 RepID=A0A239CTP4_9BURK|nr:YqiA/YcfP family alpha/beta fold hydrolase [Noviherbaspirillum humi]SNS22894.1 hypothetical protein SAMN06265795_101620 [Noviherbaspirillum humi]
MIVYLHGFRSSPQSFKARLIGQRLAEIGLANSYACPQLPASPQAAIALARECMTGKPAQEVTLIGSSLGGYYATWLAEQTGCRAVLLNPAVRPPRDLEKYVGVTTAYHSGEPFEFKREHVDELKALAVERITRPERYFLIAATGDEVLDWREMTAHYPGARQQVIQGSDHGLSDFAAYQDDVLAFCGIRLPQS